MIKIIRGDDYTFTTSFVDVDGNPVNITGVEVYFTVKNKKDIQKIDDDTALIKKIVVTHTNPVSGITEIVLTNQETDIQPGEYYYDIQIKNIDGTIQSIYKSIFEVVQDVTKEPELVVAP